jgi:hypothetical protein
LIVPELPSEVRLVAPLVSPLELSGVWTVVSRGERLVTEAVAMAEGPEEERTLLYCLMTPNWPVRRLTRRSSIKCLYMCVINRGMSIANTEPVYRGGWCSAVPRCTVVQGLEPVLMDRSGCEKVH